MDEVAAYEGSGLPERQKVALSLTDAYLTDPAGFSAGGREHALRHFSPAQIVELLLKLSTWTVNKSITALGLDEAIREERLTTFHYDATGALILHVSD
jgi:alkylhydroperoxidase family enzyme